MIAQSRSTSPPGVSVAAGGGGSSALALVHDLRSEHHAILSAADSIEFRHQYCPA